MAVSYWLLAIGCWLLAVGYWLLAIGCWLLAVGYWLLAIGYWLLAIGCFAYIFNKVIISFIVPPTSVIGHLSSVTCHRSSVTGHLSPVICHRSSVTGHPSISPNCTNKINFLIRLNNYQYLRAKFCAIFQFNK
ncbi:MAG: hypothetical protein C0596_10815 [Marinilabiliales bacterium]|nr:MAG: hypothetical protein C0596_10815 [Marinilabiliales bacterium]